MHVLPVMAFYVPSDKVATSLNIRLAMRYAHGMRDAFRVRSK